MINYRDVVFRPWVGSRYKDGGILGQRILVLGESHHCDEIGQDGLCQFKCHSFEKLPRCTSFTERVINDVIYNYVGTRDQQTFICFERAIFGAVPDQKWREDFWQSVVFYNFLQYAQSGPSRKLEQSKEGSIDAFYEVLKTLNPDKIIIWGRRLFGILPDKDREYSCIELCNGEKTDMWIYTIDGKEIPAMNVLHPCSSRGKKWAYWHQFYEQFLKK